MPRAHIRLGQSVFSRDGKRLGKVDRVILDGEGHRVEAIVVHNILGSGDKIIDVGLIYFADDDGIHLRIDANEAANLPSFVRETFVEVTPENAERHLFNSLGPGLAGTVLAAGSVAGRQTIDETTSDLFVPSIPSDATVKVESNVPAEDDVISHGTEVVASDGRKVGTVAEIFVAPDGKVTGFVVKAGFLFKRDVVIPIEWVAEIGEKHIRLKMTADDTEESGHPVPEGMRPMPSTAPGT